MMSLLRRQFNLTGIIDPPNRFTFGKLVAAFFVAGRATKRCSRPR